MITTGESELATFRGEGVGKIGPSGGARCHGSDYYRTSSSGKLAFLSNVVGLFETGVDTKLSAFKPGASTKRSDVVTL